MKILISHVRSSDGKIYPVRPEHTSRRIQAMIKYFICTPVRLCTGYRFRKTGGVPSGSTFTNIIDTIVNAIVCRTIAINLNGHLPECDIYMGDDSLQCINGMVNMLDWGTEALKLFGFVLSQDKSFHTNVRRNVFFLGYYNLWGTPWRPPHSLISSVLEPERNDDDDYVRASRLLGQMYSTLDPKAAFYWFDAFDNFCKDKESF